MLKNIVVGIFVLITLSQSETNTSKTIDCEPSIVYRCTMQECEKIEVVNIDNEIQYFEVDTKKKTLVGKIGNATVDIENIISKRGNKNTFVFFGIHTDSEFDWILRVDKKSKKMVLLATNTDLDGFTVYGICKWEEEK